MARVWRQSCQVGVRCSCAGGGSPVWVFLCGMCPGGGVSPPPPFLICGGARWCWCDAIFLDTEVYCCFSSWIENLPYQEARSWLCVFPVCSFNPDRENPNFSTPSHQHSHQAQLLAFVIFLLKWCFCQHVWVSSVNVLQSGCGQDWVWSHLMGKLSWNSVESSFSVDSSGERYMWVIIHSWWVKQLMQFPDSVDNNVSLSPLLLMVGPPLLLVC